MPATDQEYALLAADVYIKTEDDNARVSNLGGWTAIDNVDFGSIDELR